MTPTRVAKATALTALFAGFVLAGTWATSARVSADDDRDEDFKVRLGFEIAPVHLNLHGKDRVGAVGARGHRSGEDRAQGQRRGHSNLADDAFSAPLRVGKQRLRSLVHEPFKPHCRLLRT